MTDDLSPGAASGSTPPSIDLSKYTLTSAAEVVHHLRGIVQQGQMVTVFSNKGKSFILTRILALDNVARTMVLDWGANEHANKLFLESERNIYVCSPAGVKTQFTTGQPRRISFQGSDAFEVDLPEQVIKLQRREFFRIPTPIVNPVLCQFLDHPAGELALPLADISLGGAALVLSTAQAAKFHLGDHYQVSIELKPFGVLQVQLEIRHLIPVQHKNGQESIRAGCCFANMNTPRETMVQRYVANLERERRALVR